MATQWIDPIYDRTQADVDRVKELNNIGYFNMTTEQQQEWLTDLKGALNRSDLVRIENDIQILSDVLELDLDTYDGHIPEIPNTAYYKTMRENVQEIRDSGYIHTDTPTTPHSPLNGYTKINDIEKILRDVYKVLNDTFYHFCHSTATTPYGGVYAGEEIGLLL